MRTPSRFMVLVALTATGCGAILGPAVTGSGVLKQETREVGDFTEVETRGVFKANVAIGPNTSLELSGDDNLLEMVTTEVKDGRLVIAMKDGVSVRTVKPLTVTITTPRLEAARSVGASSVTATIEPTERFHAEATGASSVTISGLEADSLTGSAEGASTLALSGKAKNAKLQASGASSLKAKSLVADSVAIDVSGASNGEVEAVSSVSGGASGASTLIVRGNPAKRSATSSGASSVKYIAAEKKSESSEKAGGD